MIRSDFQQCMESVSLFNRYTVTDNYWLIYEAATVNINIMWGIILSHWVNLKLAFRLLYIPSVLNEWSITCECQSNNDTHEPKVTFESGLNTS